jgi:hypothetical protein
MSPQRTDKRIVIRKLGTGGVNLCKTPLALADHEVVSAQNAEPYADRGRTGIRKRPAYRPVNTVAVDAIQGLLSVELAQGLAGTPTLVPGPHCPIAPPTTSPGPGNPDKDDDWDPTDPGIGGSPPFPAPTDIPRGPIVLVASNGYPTGFAWKYTIDGGLTWHKTAALTHVIASDDTAPVASKTVTVRVWGTADIAFTDIAGTFELIPAPANPLDAVNVFALSLDYDALTSPLPAFSEVKVQDFDNLVQLLPAELLTPPGTNHSFTYSGGTLLTAGNRLDLILTLPGDVGIPAAIDLTVVVEVAGDTVVTDVSTPAVPPGQHLNYTRVVT